MPKVFDDYSDNRHKSWCFHCGVTLGTNPTNREHIPTKSLLNKPYPPDLPQVKVCEVCNESYSRDEEYLVAFLSTVISGSTEPRKQVFSSGKRILARNKKLRERIDQARQIKPGGGSVWMPELKRIERIVVKNARGHAFFEGGEPMFEPPSDITILPLPSIPEEQSTELLSGSPFQQWPEVGSRWMQRVLAETGAFDADGFYVVQPNTYKFKLEITGHLSVVSVIGNYLFTSVTWN